MTRIALFRWLTVFTLEAFIATGLLTLFGYLPGQFWPMLGFTVIATTLLALGAWLYQGGGRSMWIHILLYPLIAFSGMAGYLLFDSWIVGLAIAGGYYWRIHTVVTIRLCHFDLLRRFSMAVIIFLSALLYHALVVSLAHGTAGIPPLFGMLALLFIAYLIVSEGEFLTREKPAGTLVPARSRNRLVVELGLLKLIVLGAYVAVASAIFFAAAFLWSLVKGALASLLFAAFAPLLTLIEQWINRLTQALSKDRRIDLVTGNDGEPGNVVWNGVNGQEETLFSLLQPYLIGGIILAFVCWLGWKMWQRRHVPVEQAHASESTASPSRISRIESEKSGGDGLGGMVQSLLDRWRVPKDDQARYLYYQFLRYMKAQGLPMRKDETSREFMLRIQQEWQQDRRLSLVVQITDFYQRHRYQKQPLSSEEMALLENCFRELKRG